VASRILALTGLVLVAAVGLSSQSGAVLVGERGDGTLSIEADAAGPPQDSVVSIAFNPGASSGAEDDTYIVRDAAGIPRADTPPCVRPTPDDGTTVTCPATGIRRITVLLGSGNDRLTLLAEPPIPSAMRVRVLGGEGDDTIVAGARNSNRFAAFGEAGNDTLKGTAANDDLDGGDGADRLRGLDGDDTLDGGPGRDQGAGGPGDDRCDSIERGAEAECS
jgi:Ca2+-binding RTX toxin-like protein